MRIFSKLKIIFWSSRQLIISAPRETSLLTLLILIQGLIPASSLWVIKELITWLSMPNGTSLFFFFFLTCLWGGILLSETLLSPFVSIIRIQLNEKILIHINLLLMHKANEIKGLAPFEDEKLANEIEFLKTEARRRPLNFVYVLTGVGKEAISLAAVIFVLMPLGIWIPFGIVLASIPHAISNYLFEKASWDQLLFSSPENRKMAWIASQTLDSKNAKEIRLFNCGQFFVQKYQKLAITYFKQLRGKRWKKAGACLILSLISVIGNLTIFLIIMLNANKGNISIATVVVAIQALVMTQLQITGCIANISMAAPIILFFEKLKIFLSSKLDDLPNLNLKKVRAFTSLKREIRFENVSFSYPNGREILKNLNFSIFCGQRIGIIGENGAGKSTLIKLLARFYDPTKGRITVDGIDLRDISLDIWRQCLSGIFQDFGQYSLTIRENILLGDLNANHSTVVSAAQKATFAPIVKELSSGYNSLLGKEFGGTTLSGGEWQKLAMTRAFLRNADILILDEPTSALDPRSEDKLFQTFSNNSQGKTTILVTHRVTSIKRVDRLFVLKEGTLIEDGTHEELLAKQGIYHEFYNLQSSNLRNIPAEHNPSSSIPV